MKKPNCKCLACGKEYYFCLQCNQRQPRPLPSWHLNFCDDGCKEILEAVSSYCGGSISKEDADAIISKYDKAKIDTLKDNLKEKIKEIQKKDKSTKGSLVDKEPTVSKEDTSVGLMAPTIDEKDEA